MKMMLNCSRKQKLSICNYQSQMKHLNKKQQNKHLFISIKGLMKTKSLQKKSQACQTLPNTNKNSNIISLDEPISKYICRSTSVSYKPLILRQSSSSQKQNVLKNIKKTSFKHQQPLCLIDRSNQNQKNQKNSTFKHRNKNRKMIERQKITQGVTQLYQVKKQYLQRALRTIALFSSEQNKNEAPINEFFKQLQLILIQNKRILKVNNLTLNSNISSSSYSSIDYQRQTAAHKMGIQTLLLITDELNQQILDKKNKIKELNFRMDSFLPQKFSSIMNNTTEQDSIANQLFSSFSSQEQFNQLQELFEPLRTGRISQLRKVRNASNYIKNHYYSYRQLYSCNFKVYEFSKRKIVCNFLQQFIQKLYRKESKNLRKLMLQTSFNQDFIKKTKKWVENILSKMNGLQYKKEQKITNQQSVQDRCQ